MLRDFYYVYRVTHLPTSKHYIGSRSSKHNIHPEHDIGKQYFTSSIEVRKLFKARPQDFRVKIVRVYHLRYEQAWLFEQRLLRKLNVPNNPKIFNKAVTTSQGTLTRSGTIPRPIPKPRIQWGSISIVRGF